MASAIKRLIRQLVNRAGFDIVRFQFESPAMSAFGDMQRLLNGENAPLILDVGANIGQSVDRFKSLFPAATIHSFEPSPLVFKTLSAHCGGLPGVRAWNCGVGSSDGMLAFLENDCPDMSSFLPPGTSCWGKVKGSVEVPVVTLDNFAKDNGIEFIHILKSDTQGYDFEVFKGARQLMEKGRIHLVYFEFIFSDMYEGLPTFDKVFRYLKDYGFHLVAFYDQHLQGGRAGWADVLFVNDLHHRSIAAR
jgi:FkbM family methyltransferase